MATARAVNVVLVHGGFVDGAGWEGVYKILRKDGYTVSIVQNPTLSLAGDVAATKLVLAAQDRPVILVGHSYGGVVITEAGTDPKVAGLVYIAAFAPDRGEPVASLIKDPPPGAPVPPILPPQNGYLFLERAKFHASFAADVDADRAAFMADSQVPWGVEALSGSISAPAWKTKPSWYLVATEDRMIPRQPSASCRSALGRPSLRSGVVTRSTCLSQVRWRRSSRPPRRGCMSPPAEEEGLVRQSIHSGAFGEFLAKSRGKRSARCSRSRHTTRLACRPFPETRLPAGPPVEL
jgi:pimeloyl-ACP methyl ester carboxylesterase